jgi:hypothetical protein
MTSQALLDEDHMAVQPHAQMPDVLVRKFFWLMSDEAARLIDRLAQALRRVGSVLGCRKRAMGKLRWRIVVSRPSCMGYPSYDHVRRTPL